MNTVNRRGWNLRKDNPRPWITPGETHFNWKGDAAQENSKRDRARKLYALDACEECGEPATDRHHKDGDTGNNTPENIARLCRRCHMIADGRLEILAECVRSRIPKPPGPCIICLKLSKPLRKGRCHACNEYFRRKGFDRAMALHPDEGARR